jgi:tripartite-type tricarboxylate transporter receptor subunit TctC
MTRQTLLAGACAALVSCVVSGAASAQAYPERVVKLVVPYAPGGAVDLVGRAVAQKLSESMGQTVVVENRPGAGGMIGAEAVARAAPDGYTVLVVDPSVVINPSLQSTKATYALKDLQTVSMLTASPLVLTVNAALPVTDLVSLTTYAKANPGKVNIASAGIGTTPHMAAELLKARTGLGLSHVPYKGSGPAMADLIAGHVQLAFSSIAAANTYVKDGRIRAVASSSTQRPPSFASLPTLAEAGVKDFDVLFWTGLFVPKGTPTAVVDKLNAEVKKMMASPEFVASLEKSGEVPSYTPVADGTSFVKAEFDKWAHVIRDGNLSQ